MGKDRGSFFAKIARILNGKKPLTSLPSLNLEWLESRLNPNAAPYFLGSGRFLPSEPLALVSTPGQILAMDWNQDGKLDILTAQGFSNSVAISLNQGQGSFVTTTIPIPGNPQSLVGGDFDGDGILDLITANYKTDKLIHFKGIQPTQFQTGVTIDLPVGSGPRRLLATDWNRDGRTDLVVLQGDNPGVTIVAGQPGGSFGPAQTLPLDFNPAGIATGDINHDSHTDIVISPQEGGVARFFLGSGTGSFTASSFPLGFASAGQVALSDLNGDNRIDMVVADPAAQGLRVWLQQGNGQLGTSVLVGLGGVAGPLLVRDLSGDAIPDLVAALPGASRISVALGLGDGSFSSPLPFATPTPAQNLALGDFNGDQLADLIFDSTGIQEIQALKNSLYPRESSFLVGQRGEISLQAVGDPAPSYSVVEGTLPTGLTLNPTTGLLGGIPLAGSGGKRTLVIGASNGVGETAKLSLDLTVHEPTSFSPPQAALFVAGETGSISLVANGYPKPSYRVVSGSLPEGLTLDPLTGLLGGTPAPDTGGSFELSVEASNGVGNPVKQTLSLTVQEHPRFTSSDQFSIRYGENTSLQISAKGFPNPTYFADSLPEGLTLEEKTGRITGFPKTVGTYFFTVTASNGLGQDAQQPVMLSINPGVLVISADPKTKVYGAPLPALTATIQGLAPWDGPEVVQGLTLSCGASAKSPVGSYLIQPEGASSEFYTFEYRSSSLTVSRATLTITPENKTKVYGAAVPTLTAQITGLVNGDTTRVVTGLKLATTASRASKTGVYEITATGAQTANYTIRYGTGSLTVTKANLVIQADNRTRIYGSANPTFTAKWSGLTNGDKPTDFSGLTFLSEASASSPVGRYRITPQGVLSSQYAISFVDGTLTVNPAPLAVIPDEKIMERGTKLPTLTAQFKGLVLGDGPGVVSGLQLQTSARVDSPVGNYPITASSGQATNYTLIYRQGTLRVWETPKITSAASTDFTYGRSGTFTIQASGSPTPTLSLETKLPPGLEFNASKGLLSTSGMLKPGNYPLRFVASAGPTIRTTQDFTLRVGRASLTITPDNLTREFGSANPRLTANFKGFVLGDGPSTVTGLKLETTATTQSSPGSYPITASGAASDLYAIQYGAGTLTVTPKNLVWSPPVSQKIYGTSLNLNPEVSQPANQTSSVYFSTPVELSGFSTRFVFQTQALTAIPGDGFTFVIQGSGPRAIGTLGDGLGYQGIGKSVAIKFDFFNNGGEGDISTGIYLNGARPTTPAISLAGTPINLRSDDPFAADIAYDGKKIVVKITHLISGQSTTQEYPVDLGSIVGGGTAWVGFTASTGALTARQSILGWNFQNRNGQTVFSFSDFRDASRLSIQGAAVASGPALVLTGFGTAARVEPGNGAAPLSVTLHSPGIHTLAPAGTYPLVAVLTGPGAENYRLDMKGVQLVVNPAPLLIRARDAFKDYGAPGNLDPAGYRIEGKLIGTDSITSVQLTSTAVPVRANAGTHPIIPSAARGNGVSNYQITYAPGSFQVFRAQLTLSPQFKTKRYGEPLPTFTASYVGLVAGDGPEVVKGLVFETTSRASSPVGDYPITLSGAAADNYIVRIVGKGTLTVTRAPLTIRADNKTQKYGEPNPPLTATITGLVNGDPQSIVRGLQLVTDAAPSSRVGSYKIQAGSALASNNYSIEYIEGELKVEKAALTITLDDKTKVYGAPIPTLGATFSGLVNGDSPQLFADLGLTTTALPQSPIGDYPITSSRTLTATNYEVVVKPGVLRVTKAPLTITPKPREKIYGQAISLVNTDFTTSGLAGADRVDQVTLTSNGTEARAGAGVFNILAANPSGVGLENYDIRFQPGTLTVRKAPLTVTALNAQKVYGAALPRFEATFRGFVNGDTAAMVEGLQLGSTASASSAVGEYRILMEKGGSSFYEITFVSGTLTITPAPLVIQVQDSVKKLGDPNPKFSATFQGLVNGDKSTVVTGLNYQTDAGSKSPVGVYGVRARGATAKNYTITYLDGKLTIAQAPAFTAANRITLNAGQSQTYGLSVTGFPAPRFSLVKGSLPTGITLEPNLGILNLSQSTQAGTYRFSIQASNSLGKAVLDLVLILV